MSVMSSYCAFAHDGRLDENHPATPDEAHPRQVNEMRLLSDCDSGAIYLVDSRELFGECLARSIFSAFSRDVFVFKDVTSVRVDDKGGPALLILCDSGAQVSAEIQRQISTLLGAFPDTPLVIISQMDDLHRIRACISSGIRGYIPTSVRFDVAIEALRLVHAGGTYVPLNSMMQGTPDRGPDSRSSGRAFLTERQTAVVAALRRGKANKIIAHELNMKESTVKVHVRNIMKKMNAKNRTEVAFLAPDLVEGN